MAMKLTWIAKGGHEDADDYPDANPDEDAHGYHDANVDINDDTERDLSQQWPVESREDQGALQPEPKIRLKAMDIKERRTQIPAELRGRRKPRYTGNAFVQSTTCTRSTAEQISELLSMIHAGHLVFPHGTRCIRSWDIIAEITENTLSITSLITRLLET